MLVDEGMDQTETNIVVILDSLFMFNCFSRTIGLN